MSVLSQGKLKVVLVSTSQPSMNPRLTKEATALSEVGYEVVVLYSYRADWALLADELLFKNVKWSHKLLGGTPNNRKLYYNYTRVRRKVAEWTPFFPKAIERSHCQAFDELVTQAKKENANLYIAHNPGALPVAALVSQKLGVSYAFDAEDFHRGELGLEHPKSKKIIKLEDKYLPQAAYVSAASPLIAEAYNRLYNFNRPVIPINNVFPKKQQPTFRSRKAGDPLRLFWFSQTIGRDRGIEDILLAITLLPNVPIEIGLLGNCSEIDRTYFQSFLPLGSQQLTFLPVRNEADLIRLSATYDIGLALERDQPINRNLCLTNKLFTYLLAGNALLVSQTLAQSDFMRSFPKVGQSYSIGDSKAIAQILINYWEHPELLEQHRQKAWKAAEEELNWENEQIHFLNAVSKVVIE